MRVIVTHTDLDGVASAALVMKALRDVDKVMFAQPHQVPAVLGKVRNGTELYITDLGLNPSTLERVRREVERIIKSGGRVRWFDHHVWDPSWVVSLQEVGAEVNVDTSTCAAGVVRKYFPVEGKGVDALVSATCSIDLWIFDDWRGNYLVRYVSLKEGRKWREEVVRKLSNFRGELTEEVLRAAEEVINKELRLYSKVVREGKVLNHEGLRIAYYFKRNDEHATSYIGNLMLSRFNADIAVICKPNSVSLRSKGFNVRELAKALGGGGHPRASGAKLDPPMYLRLLYWIGVRTPLTGWCVKEVLRGLERVE